MDWIDLVKDWGGHILSVLGIVGGLWAYVRHDKKLKLQEKYQRIANQTTKKIRKQRTTSRDKGLPCTNS